MTTMYIVLDDELLIARGRDGAWKTDTQLVGLSPRCLAVDPFQPERVYCGSSGHTLWRSADAGSSWSVAGEGIAHPDVTAVAVSPHERTGECGALYAGTEPSALFRSEDGGGTWRELRAMRALPSAPTWSFPPRPHTNHVRWITPDVANAGTLYVCIEAGALVRSLDGGDTWMDRVPDGPVDTHTLMMHPRIPGRLYAAAGDGFGTPGGGTTRAGTAGGPGSGRTRASPTTTSGAWRWTLATPTLSWSPPPTRRAPRTTRGTRNQPCTDEAGVTPGGRRGRGCRIRWGQRSRCWPPTNPSRGCSTRPPTGVSIARPMRELPGNSSP